VCRCRAHTLLFPGGSLFFFFSSRRRHTRFSRDWSSDVCSSDLRAPDTVVVGASEIESEDRSPVSLRSTVELLTAAHSMLPELARSEERRVGKECRSRWAPDP